jgi:hypothetical protein
VTARCITTSALTSTPSARHSHRRNINAIVMNNYVTSATSPDIACLSARCCNPSLRTRRTIKIDGGQAALVMDKSIRLLLLPPIMHRSLLLRPSCRSQQRNLMFS